MDFTYDAYKQMINELTKGGYTPVFYDDSFHHARTVILRHDIDFSIEKALSLAQLESKLGVRSTYFALITSDFYNIASKKSLEMLKEIEQLGHQIGLHFDEKKYETDVYNIKNILQKIKMEAHLMGEILGHNIGVVSMHRPSKETLEANLQIDGLINSYGREFFNEFKYVSDSRRRWREDISGILREKKYDRLHILTHPFWYNQKDINLQSSILNFIDSAKEERYNQVKDNITDFSSILSKGV